MCRNKAVRIAGTKCPLVGLYPSFFLFVWMTQSPYQAGTGYMRLVLFLTILSL